MLPPIESSEHVEQKKRYVLIEKCFGMFFIFDRQENRFCVCSEFFGLVWDSEWYFDGNDVEILEWDTENLNDMILYIESYKEI